MSEPERTYADEVIERELTEHDGWDPDSQVAVLYGEVNRLQSKLDDANKSIEALGINAERYMKQLRDAETRLGNLAMMTRRLIARVQRSDRNDVVAAVALNMLSEYGLQGSILRDEPDAVATQEHVEGVHVNKDGYWVKDVENQEPYAPSRWLGDIQKRDSESQEPGLSKCPGCGGPADNGHDRCMPPNPYYCSRCQDSERRRTTSYVSGVDGQRKTIPLDREADRQGEYGTCGGCGAALHSVEDHHRHVMGECASDKQ